MTTQPIQVTVTNTYVGETRIEISGTKTWVHGTNAKKNYPDSIVVSLFAYGKLIEQQSVTAKEGWKYTFNVPVYDQNGNKIQYTISEEAVANYTTKIDGYDITNTYIEPASTATKPAIQSGDSQRIMVWLILMLLSAGVLGIVAYKRKEWI